MLDDLSNEVGGDGKEVDLVGETVLAKRQSTVQLGNDAKRTLCSSEW